MTGAFRRGATLLGLVLAGCGGGAATGAAGPSVPAAPVPAPAPTPAAAPRGAPGGAPVEVASPAAGGASAGIYTTAQAAQGQQVFRSVCSACHGINEFTGPIFKMTWMADPVGNLFQHISVAMPQDRPGALKPEEYAAVVAYFLQLNGRPPGETPLPTDVELLGRLSW